MSWQQSLSASSATWCSHDAAERSFLSYGGSWGSRLRQSRHDSTEQDRERLNASRSRVPSALHAGVPSRPILQREGRPSPTMRAGPRLMGRKLVSLTLQTLGHVSDEPFPVRQDLRSLHVPLLSSRRRPRAALVLMPRTGGRKDGPRFADRGPKLSPNPSPPRAAGPSVARSGRAAPRSSGRPSSRRTRSRAGRSPGSRGPPR